jgi:hypothetical protein
MMPANDREEAKLKLSMTKDDLRNAAEFKEAERPRTVGSGSGSGGMNRPAGGGSSPSSPPASPSK